MEKLTRATWMEIDLDNLVYNYNEIKDKLKSHTDIMAIVKSDAYQHGAEMIVRTLKEEGVKIFGVAHLSEALHIRKYHNDVDILIMGYTPDHLAGTAIDHNIIMTVYLREQAEYFSKLAKDKGKPARVHIKIETGMNRLGFLPNLESVDKIVEIYNMDNIEVEGIFSQFAVAGENRLYTNDQARKFSFVLDELEKRNIDIKKKHIMDSIALMSFYDYGYDFIRTGLLLYGVYPLSKSDRKYIRIKTILKLKSTISNIKEIYKGQSLGYGLTYTADKTTKVATIPIGYADGVSRRLSNLGRCIVNDSYAPIIGSICMDQLMIDITDVDSEIGDEVLFMGKAGDKEISIEEISEQIDEIPESLLCMLSKRIPRVYIKNRKIVEVKDYLLEL